MINGAKEIIKKLNEKGYEAYMIGGCVRDILMNNIPYDYDITTSAAPEKIIEIFPHTIPTGLKHGTVTVIMENYQYEVTTYRIDGKYLDNRRPSEVTFSENLIEDIKRRDFTINSIAYNDKDGFIDFFNGKKDIENKIIRTVNDPYDRFNEDALRILRGIRFSSKYGFKIEENTFRATKELMKLITNISGERIFEELSKMFSNNPYSAVKLLWETEFFQTIGINVNEKIFDALKALNIKCFESVFSVITFEKDEQNNILNLLKCSNKTKSTIKKIRSSFNYTLASKESIKTMLYELQCEDNFNLIADIHHSLGISSRKVYKLYNEILSNKECFSIKDLKINGNDLIKIGVTPSGIGKILDKLCRMVISNPSLNSKAQLINLVEEKVN